MKIIGDKDLFAYQWQLEDHGNTFYWGNFCFWIGGNQVGVYDGVFTTLSITLSYLKEFLTEQNARVYFSSGSVGKKELFYEIYEKYFDDEYKGDQIASFGYFRDTFWLDEVGEDSIRDKIGLILLDEPKEERQRFIWKDFATKQTDEAFVPLGYFESVSYQFINVLAAEMESF